MYPGLLFKHYRMVMIVTINPMCKQLKRSFRHVSNVVRILYMLTGQDIRIIGRELTQKSGCSATNLEAAVW